jgi:hypothetical protein
VDRDGCAIRLSAAETKEKRGRVFPYEDASSLVALLGARWKARDGSLVFHRGGQPIRSFRIAWVRACKRAGLEGRLVHDLRRSAARAFPRAGLSESDVMGLCGWDGGVSEDSLFSTARRGLSTSRDFRWRRYDGCLMKSTSRFPRAAHALARACPTSRWRSHPLPPNRPPRRIAPRPEEATSPYRDGVRRLP